DTDFTGVLKINTTRKINFGLNNIQLNPAQVSPSYGQLGFTIDGATNVDSLQANVIIASGLVKVNGPDVPVASAVAPAPDGKSSFNDLGDIQLNSSVIGSGNYKVGADEQVAIYVYSSPVFVGTYSIGSDNTINSVQSKIDDMATLAEIEPGNHTVVIYNDQGQIVSSVATTANAVSSLDGLDAEAEAAALEAARLAKTGAFGGVALAVVVFGLYYYLIRLGRKNGLKAAAK
ncbi:MAG: hypothetical protein LBN03_01425, partial [Bifidobacteriaceae bacterium]|nr:hypothetical protein [Bifidobacteriaceae bacterium]